MIDLLNIFNIESNQHFVYRKGIFHRLIHGS